MKLTFTPEEDIFIKKLYYEGAGPACQLFMPHKSVRQIGRRARALGLSVNPLKISKIIAENVGKTRFTERKNSFEEHCSLNDPKFIYLLGILWADGHVHKGASNNVNLTLIKTDVIDIENIFWYEWGFTDPKLRTGLKKARPVRACNISNRHLKRFLTENDYQIKSTTTPTKILSKIPEHLKHYWWLGYLDGDGCIYFTKKKRYGLIFTSFFEADWTFQKELEKLLNIKFHICDRKGKDGKCSMSRLHKREDIMILGNYLYANYEVDKIGLTRKYEKFLNIKNHISKRVETI